MHKILTLLVMLGMTTAVVAQEIKFDDFASLSKSKQTKLLKRLPKEVKIFAIGEFEKMDQQQKTLEKKFDSQVALLEDEIKDLSLRSEKFDPHKISAEDAKIQLKLLELREQEFALREQVKKEWLAFADHCRDRVIAQYKLHLSKAVQ